MKRILSLVLIVLMLFSACFLFSCNKDEDEDDRESSSSKKDEDEKESSSSSKKEEEVVTAKSIKLDTDKLTLKVGETYVFTVGFTPENTADKSVTFSSSSERVARVTNKGVVMGYNPGETTIMVTSSNGRVDWCTVTVVK